MKGGYTIFDFGGVIVPSGGYVAIGAEWFKRCEAAVAAGKPVLVRGVKAKSGTIVVDYPACFGNVYLDASGVYMISITTTKILGGLSINSAGRLSISPAPTTK